MSIPTSRLSDAAHGLRRHPNISGLGITGHPDRGTILEIACSPSCDAVPPGVLRMLAEHDCSIVDVTSRGTPTHYVVTAE